MVDGLPRHDIGAHHREAHRVRLQCLDIERIQLERNRAIREIDAVQVTRAQQVAHAGVTRIGTEALVVANGAAGLTLLDVHAERGTG